MRREFIFLFFALRPVFEIGAQGRSPRIEFERPTIVGRDENLARPIDVSLSRDGGIYVADYPTQRILKFNSAGQLQWRQGRKGSGPGEYQIPARVTALTTGDVLVYDQGRRAFTLLDSAGTYKQLVEVELTFRQVNTIIALPDGGIAVSGRSEDTAAQYYAIHVFDSKFRHVRSFGSLPIVKDPRLSSYVTAGALSLANGRTLLLTTAAPYEIRRYTLQGQLLQTINPPYKLETGPEDAFSVSEVDGRQVTRIVKEITRPRTAVELADGRVLAGKIGPSGSTLDVYSRTGELLGSQELPSALSGLAVYDGVRNLFWILGSVDDEPVVLRVALASHGSVPFSNRR